MRLKRCKTTQTKNNWQLAISIAACACLISCGGSKSDTPSNPTDTPPAAVTPSATPASSPITAASAPTPTASTPTPAASSPTAPASSPVVDQGTSVTTWATPGATVKPPVTPGTWRAAGPEPKYGTAGFKLVKESAHFAFYSDEVVSQADLQLAVDTLENGVWNSLFNSGLLMPEPFYNKTDKIKTAIHIHSDWGLSGGAWVDEKGLLHPGMWIGPASLKDNWGLTHEFTHAWQNWASSDGGLSCNKANTCGWFYESHANFTPHQTPEFKDNVHFCSETLFNVPHVYLGSTRDRYCNWQFMEYLKDKYGPEAVTQIWTTAGDDPFTNIQKSRGWSLAQLNDFMGDWAAHNVVWDYKAAPDAFRKSYGNITLTDNPNRLRRLMPLEPLDGNWATNRRFASPFLGAPQRFGYNVVRLYPTQGATTVTVKFRGINQTGSDADFRWSLVATNNEFTSARYSALQKGLDADLTFKVHPGEPLFMVVSATPSKFQSIVWDQAYETIWRYPYTIELANAWPQGFQNGQRDACPTGTVRHANGGGCAPGSTPTTMYVGPYALVQPGATVTGNARIEDQAIVTANGTVTGGTVGGISVIGGNNAFTVSGSAQVYTTLAPMGSWEGGQVVSGTAKLYGDVELRDGQWSLNAGTWSGLVYEKLAAPVGTGIDINQKTKLTWRP